MNFDKELPIFKLNVNGHEELVDPNTDLHVYDADLKSEFCEQPSKFAFYGGLHADAMANLTIYKNNLKKYEADNEQEIRARVADRYGDKKPTIGMVEAEFARDEKWQAINAAIIEQQRFVSRLEVIRDAFKQRAQMLWQLGATARQEMVRLNVEEPDNN